MSHFMSLLKVITKFTEIYHYNVYGLHSSFIACMMWAFEVLADEKLDVLLGSSLNDLMYVSGDQS